MNFAPKLIQKADTKLIQNSYTTLYQLRINSVWTLRQSWYNKLIQSWYTTLYQLCIDYVWTLHQSCYKNKIQSWYRVVTHLCINFVSTPYELCIKVGTKSWYKVDTVLIHNFVSTLYRLSYRTFCIKVDTKRRSHGVDTELIQNLCINFVYRLRMRTLHGELIQKEDTQLRVSTLYSTTFEPCTIDLIQKILLKKLIQIWNKVDTKLCIRLWYQLCIIFLYQLCIAKFKRSRNSASKLIQSSHGVDTKLIQSCVSSLYRLRMNFAVIKLVRKVQT